MDKNSRFHIFLLISLIAGFVWSIIDCRDLLTWFLEALPAIIGVPILIAVYKRFRCTNLLYFFVWLHSIVLLIGAHYTYAEMPLFNWIRDTYHLSRNHYDRLGHFFQGFVPALIARELLLRTSPLKPSKWLFFIILCICMFISSVYELIEWQAAVLSEDGAVAFLATQGDVWDTQKDMFMCLVGSLSFMLLMTRFHDKQLKTIT
jgi:putative membrane protein